MKIAVAGATGRVGKHVVDVLEAGAHEVVAMSRASGVDVISGKGLAQALKGVEAVIDVASGPSPDQDEATAFFRAASRNLQRAASQAGVQRMIVISMIGIDRFTAGYMAAKVAHEKAMNPSDPDSELYEAGALLPGARAILAGPSFDEWLEANVRREPAGVTPAGHD